MTPFEIKEIIQHLKFIEFFLALIVFLIVVKR